MHIPSGVAGQFPNCIDRSSCVIAHVRRPAWNARHAEEPGSVIKTLVMISSYIVLLYTLASNAACDPKFYLPGFGFSFLDISAAKGKWEDQGGQLSDVELACPCQPCRAELEPQAVTRRADPAHCWSKLVPPPVYGAANRGKRVRGCSTIAHFPPSTSVLSPESPFELLLRRPRRGDVDGQ